jgi:amino acid transporter
MAILDFLFGSPLPTTDERAERIGPTAGIPIFGLDALSSAAYGPEAALTLLIPLGAAGVAYILPISISIIVLLSIVFFSYRQTIETYPGGGGSYTVARAQSGRLSRPAGRGGVDDRLHPGGGSGHLGGRRRAGVGRARLQPHTLMLCLAILVVVTLVNLRGVRETGIVFLVPTYLFVGTLLIAIAIGLVKTLSSGGIRFPW